MEEDKLIAGGSIYTREMYQLYQRKLCPDTRNSDFKNSQATEKF